MIPGSKSPRSPITLAWLLFGIILTSCSADPTIPFYDDTLDVTSTAIHTIYVTSNGWHSGIVLEKDDFPPDRIPEIADFPNAQFIEFGWGDAEYYPAREATIGMTLRAAMIPTAAVLHVAGLTVSPEIRYPDDEIISLETSYSGLRRLIDHIDFTFERGNSERAAAVGPGLHEDSHFYPAKGKFHLFNTCNTWSARVLASAGFEVSKTGVHSAEELMRQVKPLGRPLRNRQ